MGYSITHEQAEKLRRNEQDGRLCRMATGRGGCFNRATVKVTEAFWPYHVGEGNMSVCDMTLCARHARGMTSGYQGENFEVLSVERF